MHGQRHISVIDPNDDITRDSAIVRVENTRKATKRTSVDDVKEIRHSVMVTDDISRGQWNQRTRKQQFLFCHCAVVNSRRLTFY